VRRPETLCPEAQEWHTQAHDEVRSYGASAPWAHGLLLLTAVVSPDAPDKVLDSVGDRSLLRVKLVNKSSRPAYSVSIRATAEARLVIWHDRTGDTTATTLKPVKALDADKCLRESEASPGFHPVQEGMETFTSSMWICGRPVQGRPARSKVFCRVPPEARPASTASGTIGGGAHHLAARGANVFMSYAHADRTWLQEFEKMLSPAQSVRLWTDQQIPQGSEWKDEIDRAMERCDAGLFFITKEALASAFVVGTELPYFLEQARRGKKKLFWVAVSAALHDLTPLAGIQCLNDPAKALVELSKGEVDREIQGISRKLLEALKK